MVLEDGSEIMYVEPLTGSDPFTKEKVLQIWNQLQKYCPSQNGDNSKVIYVSLREISRARKFFLDMENDSLVRIVCNLIGHQIISDCKLDAGKTKTELENYRSRLLNSVGVETLLFYMNESLKCLEAVAYHCLRAEVKRDNLLSFLYLYRGFMPLGTTKDGNFVLLCK